MELLRIKRLPLKQLAKASAVTFGAVGLIIGVLFFLFGLMQAVETGEFVSAIVDGLLAVIAMPIVYAISGTISVVIIAFIFNKTSFLHKGVDLEVEGKKQPI